MLYDLLDGTSLPVFRLSNLIRHHWWVRASRGGRLGSVEAELVSSCVALHVRGRGGSEAGKGVAGNIASRFMPKNLMRGNVRIKSRIDWSEGVDVGIVGSWR